MMIQIRALPFTNLAATYSFGAGVAIPVHAGCECVV